MNIIILLVLFLITYVGMCIFGYKTFECGGVFVFGDWNYTANKEILITFFFTMLRVEDIWC